MRLFAPAVKFVLEFPDHPILILIIPLQLLDLILQNEYDAGGASSFLRFQRLAMTLNLDIFLLRRGLLVMMDMALTFLMLLLALRALTRGLLIPADLINHNYYTIIYKPNEHTYTNTYQTG